MNSESAALKVLAQGLPIRKTLEAVCALAANLQSDCRCGILLPEKDGFAVAVDRDIRSEDRMILDRMAQTEHLDELCAQGRSHALEVRPLLTQSSELVGIAVIFGFNPHSAGTLAIQRLDEVCCLATLAIEQRNLLVELSYRANHDPLTHLWNRSRMEEQIQRALDAAGKQGRVTGLIVTGIDSFRVFNEVLGRPAGDQLLRLIVDRLVEFLEPGLLLARSGGDEFTILVPNLLSSGRVTTLATQLRAWLEKPFQLGHHELVVRASFGTAISTPGECQASTLQSRADQALLFAKERARGRVAAFSEDMTTIKVERLVMERHLRFALQRDEFALHYQPQVRLLAGTIVGVEALLRWKHPSLGTISPMTFVPLAEELGIIEEIGEWVLGQAIGQLQAWNDAGLCNIRMAVNVSVHQFAREDFVDTVAKLLNNSRIEPKNLELEITETALMKSLEHGKRQLSRLRALGIQIALDDFGTGHSSLAYLQHFPIDRIKIDRMFVKDIVHPDEEPPLLASIVQIGLGLGCDVIAEGIETVEQALALSKMNCKEAQGYLYAKPLPPEDLMQWAGAHSTNVVLNAPLECVSVQELSASERRT